MSDSQKKAVVVSGVVVALGAALALGWYFFVSSPSNRLSDELVEATLQDAKEIGSSKTWGECVAAALVPLKEQGVVNQQSATHLFLRACMEMGTAGDTVKFCADRPELATLLARQQWQRSYCQEQGFGYRGDCIRVAKESLSFCASN
jgi:hypothetical protein